MSATGSAGLLTFESPWVVNQVARVFRMRSCSALSVFPTIRPTSQRLRHKGIPGRADTDFTHQGPSAKSWRCQSSGKPPGVCGCERNVLTGIGPFEFAPWAELISSPLDVAAIPSAREEAP